MIIEVLYPCTADLYGEKSAITYLSRCIPDCRFIYTGINDRPAFADLTPDIVYIGTMTEGWQERIAGRFLELREEILKYIESGKVFLALGNASELFAKYVECEDGRKFDCLGLFNVYAKRDMAHRYHSPILGEMEGFQIAGFKAQFSHMYGDNSDCYVYKVLRGDGLNPGSKLEGLRYKNLICTYTIGPMVVINPYFTEYLLKLAGCENPQLLYRDIALEAFECRVKEFEDSKTKFI